MPTNLAAFNIANDKTGIGAGAWKVRVKFRLLLPPDPLCPRAGLQHSAVRNKRNSYHYWPGSPFGRDNDWLPSGPIGPSFVGAYLFGTRGRVGFSRALFNISPMAENNMVRLIVAAAMAAFLP